MKKLFTWKKYHRWVGLVLAVFLLVFCVSGIILNHRALFSSCDVSRTLLPASYHISNYNNGIIKGTVTRHDGRVVAYGCAGVWLTDQRGHAWSDMNAGLPSGADQRNVRNMVVARDGTIWCVTNYEAYRHDGHQWRVVPTDHHGERLADVTLTGDSTQVVVLSRSAAYVIGAGDRVGRTVIPAPKGYAPRETLFRTVWKLHSGELFGLPGRLVVDAVAVVLIVLSLTGIVLFITPYSIRRHRRKGNKDACRRGGRTLAWNQRWHNRLGAWTVVLTLFLTFSGACLRPPLMIPLVLVKTAAPVPADNLLHDRLRALRWDSTSRAWLISTADGFFYADEAFRTVSPMLAAAPPVSPMGINTFVHQSDGTWLVGSFSGLYQWNTKTSEIRDYITGRPAPKQAMMMSSVMATGFSQDFQSRRPIVFDYSRGALSSDLGEMPELLARAPMSLWNVALELHVGRCYAPLLGPLSSLFVFLWGTLTALIVLSGYIVYRRQKKRKNQSK